MLGVLVMATISDHQYTFVLTPRRYSEVDEDPFMVSTCTLHLDGRRQFQDYGVYLLKSEYIQLFRILQAVCSGKRKTYRMESVEPLLRLTVKKKRERILFRVELMGIKENGKSYAIEGYDLFIDASSLELFKDQLHTDFLACKDPSKLP